MSAVVVDLAAGPDRQAWRYEGPNVAHEGWFIAFLDSAGCLSVQSDFGDYAYRWPMAGMPMGKDGVRMGMREFVATVLGRDPWYVLGKFARRTEFDAEGSARNVRKWILDERRERSLDREDAADEWDLVSRYLDGAPSSDMWISQTSIDEPWNLLASDKYPEQARAFMERVFPRVVAAVRADLERSKP